MAREEGAPDAGTQPASTRETRCERIVRLAAELFLERGYDCVSINDIIQVVGGSKGTIYAYFGSKEKLFAAVVKTICADVTLQIDTRCEGTLEDQLARMAKSFVAIVLSPRIVRFHRLMTAIGRTFPEAGLLFYESGPRRAHGLIARWIAHHQATGALRRDADPMRLAVLFHDMLIGDAMLTWLTAAATEEERLARVEETVALAVRVFLAGARPSA